jgi:hypothetical protein
MFFFLPVCSIVQFYFPLYLSSLTCIVAFGFVVHHIVSMKAGVEGAVRTAKDDARDAEQRGVFLRLGFQLAVMMIIFLPDSFSYYITGFTSYPFPPLAYTITTFMWKMESWMVALMWYSNLRIQTGIKKLPFMVPIFSALGCGEAPVVHSDYDGSQRVRVGAFICL